MARMTLRGITWGHRRAIDPLTETMPAFRTLHPDIDIQWSARPLSGFESTSVEALARDYDLIVLDHPFCGLIVETGCLLRLDELLTEQGDPFVGPSLSSYKMAGSLWAMPIDAACQVAVSRPDLMQALDCEVPSTWDEMIALGELAQRNGQWLATSLSGVHSLMTFFTLMANLGKPCATNQNDNFADPDAARKCLAHMRNLLRLCPADVLDWNSIRLHDEMASRDDLVYCPAVYCYATYAEADQKRPLRFHDLPGPRGSGGSTIGGTGLGVSAHSRHREKALTYTRFAAEASTQHGFAMHHGQPARRDVWHDDKINARFGDSYRNTQKTIDRSWIRPRYNGYLAFQERAGELVESHLRGTIEEDTLLVELQRLHTRQ